MGGANETDEGKREVRTQIHLTAGGYFDAPVDDCKTKTLVIQQGTLPGSERIVGCIWWNGAGYLAAPYLDIESPRSRA